MEIERQIKEIISQENHVILAIAKNEDETHSFLIKTGVTNLNTIQLLLSKFEVELIKELERNGY